MIGETLNNDNNNINEGTLCLLENQQPAFFESLKTFNLIQSKLKMCEKCLFKRETILMAINEQFYGTRLENIDGGGGCGSLTSRPT